MYDRQDETTESDPKPACCSHFREKLILECALVGALCGMVIVGFRLLLSRAEEMRLFLLDSMRSDQVYTLVFAVGLVLAFLVLPQAGDQRTSDQGVRNPPCPGILEEGDAVLVAARPGQEIHRLHPGDWCGSFPWPGRPGHTIGRIGRQGCRKPVRAGWLGNGLPGYRRCGSRAGGGLQRAAGRCDVCLGGSA